MAAASNGERQSFPAISTEGFLRNRRVSTSCCGSVSAATNTLTVGRTVARGKLNVPIALEAVNGLCRAAVAMKSFSCSRVASGCAGARDSGGRTFVLCISEAVRFEVRVIERLSRCSSIGGI